MPRNVYSMIRVKHIKNCYSNNVFIISKGVRKILLNINTELMASNDNTGWLFSLVELMLKFHFCAYWFIYHALTMIFYAGQGTKGKTTIFKSSFPVFLQNCLCLTRMGNLWAQYSVIPLLILDNFTYIYNDVNEVHGYYLAAILINWANRIRVDEFLI